LSAGKTSREIIFFRCPKSTIYDIVKRCVTLEESKEGNKETCERKNNKDSRIHPKSSRTYFGRSISIRKLAAVLKKSYSNIGLLKKI